MDGERGENVEEVDNANEENVEAAMEPPPSEVSGEPIPSTSRTESFGYVCPTCNIKFAKKFNRDRHVKLTHNNIVRVFDCTFCGAFFDSMEKLRQHRQSHRPVTGFEVKTSAFRKKCVIYRKKYGEKMLTFEHAFNDDKEQMFELINFEVGERKSMKVGVIYHVEFQRLKSQVGDTANENEEQQGNDDDPPEPNESENMEEGVEPQFGAGGNDDDWWERSASEGEEEHEMEHESEVQQRENAANGSEETEHEEVPHEVREEEVTLNAAETEDDEREISVARTVDEEVYEICLRAPSMLVTTATNISHVLRVAQQCIRRRIEDFVENGSGWRVNEVLYADLELGTCAALNGSCNLVSVEYLKSVDSTRLSKNTQKCFLHACAFHFVRSQNTAKLDTFARKYFNVKIASPVKVADIPRFERHNEHLNFKINVIYLEEEKLFPLIFSKKIKADHHITLLLYKTVVQGKVVNHYSYISNVDKLLRKCYKGKSGMSYEKSLHCLNCFSKFCQSKTAEKRLAAHYELCTQNEPQAIKIPEEGDTIHFKNHLNKFPSHFVGFFDFESRHKKQQFECSKCEMKLEGDNPECHHQTLVKAVQEPITYSYLIMDKHGEIMFNNTYTGYDCVSKFLEELVSIESDLLAVLNANVLLNMSAADEELFAAATHCHICEEELPDEDRVRDHCHVSGQFLGAAHNTCNLGRVVQNTIPLFCHNLTGYDGHFLLQHLGQIEGITKLTALPYNTEKFRTIEINSYRLKDSLSFLNASLNELMSNLLRDKSHTFPIIDQLGLYSKQETEKKQLILRKGIYPYEFVTSIRKLRQTRKIPAKRHFFSSLTNSNVSDEDYAHSKKVFKVFSCKDLVEYTELYCATDVGILAEVVTQFRKLVQHNFDLDCCHYISTPQMAFDCMLRLTKVEIELLHDVDQILFIEQNIRGGVSYINQRHCVEEKTPEQTVEMKFIDGECFLLILRLIFLGDRGW